MNDHMIEKNKGKALRTALLTSAAIMLVMSAVMSSAWAYFTTYARAKGGYVLHMGHEEHVQESFANWNKKLAITCTEGSKPVHVRARAFCADFTLSFSDESIEEDGGTTVNEKWIPAQDGWVYYTKVLPESDGEGNVNYTADPLYIRINGVPSYRIPELVSSEEFNVIIVYETTELQYDDSGNVLSWDKVDWTKKIDTKRTSVSSSDTSEASGTSDTGDSSNSESEAGGEE